MPLLKEHDVYLLVFIYSIDNNIYFISFLFLRGKRKIFYLWVMYKYKYFLNLVKVLYVEVVLDNLQEFYVVIINFENLSREENGLLI